MMQPDDTQENVTDDAQDITIEEESYAPSTPPETPATPTTPDTSETPVGPPTPTAPEEQSETKPVA